MTVVAFTAVTGAGLPGALSLARDLRRRHPEWRLGVLWVDGPDEPNEARVGFDFIMEAQALYGDDWRRFVFRHDPREAVAAAKARALTRLLAEGAQRVLYFSPDIAVLDDLADLAATLRTASVVLTPHLLSPEETAEGQADNEGLARRCGVFNLDFLGVGADAQGLSLAHWLQSRVDRACVIDPAEGHYLDQRYFDLVPSLFDRAAIHRDPGCNVASWNLNRRRLGFAADGRLLVNGEHPLRFYNFSAEHDEGRLATERNAGRNLAPFELLCWRRRSLSPQRPHGWAYGVYDDGTAISPGARRLYGDDPELQARFADPFASGPESLRAYLQAARPDLA